MENYIPFLIRLKKDTEKSVSFFESVYKPSYVENGHLSRLPVTRKLQRPTLGHDGQPYNPMCGLASDGVYMCPCCYQQGGSLLHCLSTLTRKLAVYFCCTILRVASTGRYPASCPMKLGLSSPETFRYKQARPFDRLEINIIIYLFICKESDVKITSTNKFT